MKSLSLIKNMVFRFDEKTNNKSYLNEFKL